MCFIFFTQFTPLMETKASDFNQSATATWWQPVQITGVETGRQQAGSLLELQLCQLESSWEKILLGVPQGLALPFLRSFPWHTATYLKIRFLTIML